MTMNLNPVMSIIANVPAAVTSTVRLTIPIETHLSMFFQTRSRLLALSAVWQTFYHQTRSFSRKFYAMICFNDRSLQSNCEFQDHVEQLIGVPIRPTKCPSLCLCKTTEWRSCPGRFILRFLRELLPHWCILDRWTHSQNPPHMTQKGVWLNLVS